MARNKQREQRERLDRYLERNGLLNYQTKGLSQAQIAERYAQAGVQVQDKWFQQNYKDRPAMTGGGGPTFDYLKPQAPSQPQPMFDHAFGSPQPQQALTTSPSPMEKPETTDIKTGWGTFAGQVNTPLDPMRKSVMQFALNNNMQVTQGEKPQPMNLSAAGIATVQDALNGQANWSDVEVSQREAVLNDPNFYATNQITKYPTWMQQQILADPNFKWDNLPKWQKMYFDLSSSPAGMGMAQGALMGLGAGNPLGGAFAGGVFGYGAGKSGYDATKEAWQQEKISSKFFGWLNFLAEQAEKGIGMGVQSIQAAQDPNLALKDVFTKEGWNAGATTFEVLGPAMAEAFKNKEGAGDDLLRFMPVVYGASNWWDVLAHPDKYKGSELFLGATEPVALEQTFQERMTEARERIKGGENYREVMMDFQTGVMGQMADMMGQAIADPLNVMPNVKNKAAGKIADLTGNKVAAEAFNTTKGLGEAKRKYKTLVQTGEALKIDPKFKVDQMGSLSRWAAGINQAGEIKAGGVTDAGMLDPIKKVQKKNLKGWVDEMTSLTPQARAQLGAGMFYENVGALLTRFDDPHEAGKYLKALANSDMETWAQLGSQFADSPEFYTVLPAIKDFNASALDGIVRAWDETTANRDTLTRVADLLGEQPGKWLEDAGKRGTFEQDFRRLVEAAKKSDTPEAKALLDDIRAGRLTPDTLKQTVDTFTGDGALAWHPGQWKAQVLDAMGSHFDEWVTKRMMLDQTPEAKSAFFRTAALMKTAQSILLLGGSPGYAITNGLSNMVHRAATGVFGYMTQKQIGGWMERFGVNPARFDEGVGIGGMVEQARGKSQVKTDAMAKAVKGEGALTNAKEKLSNIAKKMPFSKLSSWFEQNEGRQAFTIGMRQFWNESWRRGKGFKAMPPELVQAIKGMGVDPNHIYAAIEAGMNQGEIEKALYGRWEGVQSRSLVDAAAQKAGVSAGDAARMLDKIGVLDTLDSFLKGQTTRDGVSAAFVRAERVAQDWMDMQMGEDLKAMAEHTAQKAGLEGAASGLDVIQKANATYFDSWLDHYHRFGEVMNDLSLLDDPAMRSKAIDNAYAISDAEFRRINARTGAVYKGIFDAWGLNQFGDVGTVLSSIGESDAAMKLAYDNMRGLRKEFFEKYRGDWDNPARWDDWEAVSRNVDKTFKDAFDAKARAEKKMGEAIGNIYESRYGPAAGEAARKWWGDVTEFNADIVKREQKARREFAGMDRDAREAAKQKYYQETKALLIAEAQKINEEGIARLERVIRKGGGQEGSAPQTTPPPTPTDSPSPQPSPDVRGGVAADEVNALMAAAEQRKAAVAQQAAEKMGAIWDVAEEYARAGLPYDRGVLQDKFALLGALRKAEYGGDPSFTGLGDERVTPELVRQVMENRRLAKEAEGAQVVTQAMVKAEDAASNVKAPRINENTTILRAISEHGGIRYDMAKDLTGDKRPKSAPGVFTKKGVGIDEMARMLADDGYPINLNDPTDPGGIRQTTELLNAARRGDKVYPMGHDHEAMLARAQNDAAMKAFGEELLAAEGEPFDGALWQAGFEEAVRVGDLTMMYEKIGELPEAMSDQPSAVSPNETWADYVSRISDEVAVRVEQEARETSIAETMVRVEDAMRAGEERADYATTRNLLKEKFAEAFDLTDEQAQAYMELSDAIAGWYERKTGEGGEGMYNRYYKDVVRGEQSAISDQPSAFEQGLEPINRRMTGDETASYARALVRQGADELRRAVQGEAVKADRIAILNEAHKLNPKMAESVAKQNLDILYQEVWHGSPHKFDKFTLDHIGSGEGVQAYGWGLYFTDTKAVADWYRTELARVADRDRFFNGRKLEKGTPEYHAASLVLNGWSLQKARKEVARWIRDALPEQKQDVANWTRTLEILHEATSKKDFIEKQAQGQLYSVEIPDEGYLLWDRPLSEQPQKIQDTLLSMMEEKNPRLAQYMRESVGLDEAGKRLLRKKMNVNVFDALDTAGAIYQSFGNDKATSLALNKAGVNGIKFLDGTSRAAGEGSYNYVIFDENAVKVLDTYYQATEGGVTRAKGAVTFGPDGIKATIHAFEAADFTTVVHENAHVFRRMLADVAARVDDAQVKADLATIEEWTGVRDGKWTVEAEEKFARGFERYLAEGQAPTPKLRAAFESFKTWMLEVYRKITGSSIDVKVTDDVKAVFDRMLGDESTRQIGIEERLRTGGDQRQPVFRQLRDAWKTLDEGSQQEALTWILEKTTVDPLSGLETLVAKSISGEKPKGWVEAVSDLNALTAINNTWGHGAGDALIAGIGRIAKEEVAKVGGRAFRVGGDEFSYWFPNNETARAALNAIDTRVSDEAFNVGGEDRSGFSVSYGIGDTLKLADDALYKDKVRRVTNGQRPEVRDQMPSSVVRVADKLRQMKEDTLYQQGRVTETAEFKSWFGDSKVVDENGEPLVVYHGKGQAVEYIPAKPSPEIAEARKAVWDQYHRFLNQFPDYVKGNIRFEDLPQESKNAINDAIDRRIDELNKLPKEPQDYNKYLGAQLEGDAFDPSRSQDIGVHFGNKLQASEFTGEDGAVFPVYLSVQNLVEVSDIFSRGGEYVNAVRELDSADVLDVSKVEDLLIMAEKLEKLYNTLDDPRDIGSTKQNASFWKKLNKAIKKEVDGFSYQNEVEGSGKSYVVLRPEQIKSAIGNRGTFDPSDPNILFQDADLPVGAMDQASQFLPHSEVMEEGWMRHVKPLLNAMQEGALEQVDGKRFDGFGDQPLTPSPSPDGRGGMGSDVQGMMRQYMNGVKNDMATSKLAAMRWGESQRDFAMLNYSKRYGFDRWLDVVYPYQFYYTRSMMTWATRTLDAPAWFSNYARLRMQQNRYERDIPERLRGKVKIPAPWMPDWMGDNLYIDPMQNLFTPANFLRPFERMEQDRTQQQLEAERVLQEWAAEGNYSESEIQQAVQERSGSVWERALEEASVRREAEIANPADFFSTMFGPAWYLSTPLNMAGIKVPGLSKGDPNKVSTLPLTNTARAFETVTQGTWAEPIGDLIGLLGKPEEWARNQKGLPTMGEYGEYYTKRQLTNMVIEGMITPEDAQLAMIEKKGELWDQASERVKLELAMRVPTMGAIYAGLHGENAGEGLKNLSMAALPTLFGSGLLPEGELEYRGLKEEWNEAWKRYDAGDKAAVTNFFDEHPEYEAYLAKGKSDEELMQSFLVGKVWDGYSDLKSQVWEKYMALGKTNQKQVSAELGEVFRESFLNKETRDYSAIPLGTLLEWDRIMSGGGEVPALQDDDLFGQAFLNKETRSYESIPTETLIAWARALSQRVPTMQNGQEIAASTAPMGTESVSGVNLYDPSVTRITDEFFAQRTAKFPNYYEVQAGYYALPKSERASYLRQNPELKSYWDWKDSWYDSYPDLVPVMNGQVFKRVDTTTWPPMLEEFVTNYAYSGEKIPNGARKALEQQWILAGRPYDDLDTWINSVVVPGLMYGK